MAEATDPPWSIYWMDDGGNRRYVCGACPVLLCRERLAVIVGDTSTEAVAEFATVELTKNERLQLLERAEVNRIRESKGLFCGQP